jgi:hypothetical protein
MTPERRAFIHAVASVATFVFAGTLLASLAFMGHTGWDWSISVITAVGALVIALIAINGLPVRGLRIRRGEFSAEALKTLPSKFRSSHS